MNKIFIIYNSRRTLFAMLASLSATSRILLALLSVLLATSLAGCSKSDAVRVNLQVRQVSNGEPRRCEIRAQVSGPQSGLRYKWLSDSGECDPQETDWPVTTYKFADGSTHDQVAVEVWLGNKRVAHDQIEVRLGEERIRKAAQPLPVVQIEITNVPPFEPHGGPDTRADIAGKVSGEIASDQKVIIYTRADELWYVQPTPYASHAIRPDNTWATWTHTGSNYAALIVRQSFTPVLVADVLPQVGGDVLARAIVEGQRN